MTPCEDECAKRADVRDILNSFLPGPIVHQGLQAAVILMKARFEMFVAEEAKHKERSVKLHPPA